MTDNSNIAHFTTTEKTEEVEKQEHQQQLSIRRNRTHLQIEALKIQTDWERKQRMNNMEVHGPFGPTFLSKENMS